MILELGPSGIASVKMRDGMIDRVALRSSKKVLVLALPPRHLALKVGRAGASNRPAV